MDLAGRESFFVNSMVRVSRNCIKNLNYLLLLGMGRHFNIFKGYEVMPSVRSHPNIQCKP